jgi:hypothetical protein
MTSETEETMIELSDAERRALCHYIELETPALGEHLGGAVSAEDFEREVERARLHARVWRAVESGTLPVDAAMCDLLRRERTQVEGCIGDDEIMLARLRAGDVEHRIVGLTPEESERTTVARLADLRRDVAALDGLLDGTQDQGEE